MALPADRSGQRLPGAVLFVCSQNTIRSPMCEWMLKRSHGSRIYVDSAGVRAGQPPDPFAVFVMAEIGIDLGRHHPKTLDDFWGSSFDLVVTLSPEAHHRALELTRSQAVEVEYWPTFDPTAIEGTRETMMNAYRELRDLLRRRLDGRFPALDGRG